MTERSTPPSSPPSNPRKFEQALDELETIIEKLESGQVGLEDCLVEYERGRKLIVECESILSRVRDRIAELSVGPDGSLKESSTLKENAPPKSPAGPGAGASSGSKSDDSEPDSPF